MRERIWWLKKVGVEKVVERKQGGAERWGSALFPTVNGKSPRRYFAMGWDSGDSCGNRKTFDGNY